MAVLRAAAVECCHVALRLPAVPCPAAVSLRASRICWRAAAMASPAPRLASCESWRFEWHQTSTTAFRQFSHNMQGVRSIRQPHQSLHAGRCAAASTDVPAGSTTDDREILVQHLLVREDQLPLLVELQKRILQGGEDLSDLAAEYSLCPSKANGGMIGWISKGRTVAEFEAAAFGAAMNQVVKVKTKHGWHLLQVLAEREAPRLEQIPPEEFSARLEAHREGDEVQLVDVREPFEIATASIEGFRPYPLSQFGQWATSITEDLDPDKETYVLCHHGVRSQQAAEWLKSQGFKKLYNIVGGIDAYSRKVDPTIPQY